MIPSAGPLSLDWRKPEEIGNTRSGLPSRRLNPGEQEVLHEINDLRKKRHDAARNCCDTQPSGIADLRVPKLAAASCTLPFSRWRGRFLWLQQTTSARIAVETLLQTRSGHRHLEVEGSTISSPKTLHRTAPHLVSRCSMASTLCGSTSAFSARNTLPETLNLKMSFEGFHSRAACCNMNIW